MSVRTLALTTLGHPVTVVENPIDVSRIRLLFIGGVHGDEPEGVHLATKLVNWLKERDTSFSWSLIPCLNPDGYFSEPRRRTNGRGVDLNRNFPAKDWSAASRAPRYFPGTFAASEMETQALVTWMKNWKPTLIVHFHSYTQPCVIYTGDDARNFSEMVSRHCGYPAKPDIGYPTPGSLGQYGWLDCKIPVVCVEELEGIDLDSIWPRFQLAFEDLNQNADKYFMHKPSADPIK